MRLIAASEAKAKLLGLLDDVERGETIVVTRHGKPVARLVPDDDAENARRELAVERLRELRKRMPKFTADEIAGMIREGRKY